MAKRVVYVRTVKEGKNGQKVVETKYHPDLKR